tara:strand:- start:816 stop:1232 length:417 start_codon:yes stop_codon:yes gene_type:complete
MQNRRYPTGNVVVDLSERIPKPVLWEKVPVSHSSRRLQQAIISGFDLAEEVHGMEFLQRFLAHPAIADEQTAVFRNSSGRPQPCYLGSALTDPQIQSFARMVREHEILTPAVFSNGLQSVLFLPYQGYVVTVYEDTKR